ncbi:MAG: rhomboid family intramembrane serine protease [Candidatus Bipolaricaulota bacterium]|nr:MAG: rhomboid family intramembrane serine protease [Candidatus Bipolaricaulota bacterium]
MIPLRDYRRSRTFPVVTVALVIVNLLVFSFQLTRSDRVAVVIDLRPWEDAGVSFLDGALDHRSMGAVTQRDAFILAYGLVPGEFLRGVDLPPLIPIPIWLTLLSMMFLHGGLLHVLGNLLYLWIFGDNVEDAMGHVRFLVFYLVCGALAAFAQIAIGPSSGTPLIGASGAIAGVLAAYLMLFPHSRVLTLIPIFFFLRLTAIPAVVLLGLWFLFQVLSGVSSIGVATGVAWFAHIGGFVAGAFLVFLFRRRGVPVVLWQMIRHRR